MASKRKSSAPSRVDSAKRYELSWNMTDLFVHADNHFLLHHVENCETSSELVSNRAEDGKYGDTTVAEEEFPLDEKLRSLIDNCDFYLNISGKASSSSVTDGQWRGLFGQIELRLTDTPSSVFTFFSCLMEHVKEFWLYVDMTAGKHLVYIPLDSLTELSVPEASVAHSVGMTKKIIRKNICEESYEMTSALYFTVETEMPASFFDGLQSKREFQLKLSSCNLQRESVIVDLFVLEAALFQPKFPCDAVKPRRCHLALQHLVHHFYGICEQCKFLVACSVINWEAIVVIDFMFTVFTVIKAGPQIIAGPQIQAGSLIEAGV